MATDVSQIIATVDDVLLYIAPYSGGAVPSVGSDEYKARLRWIQNKQDEYSRRGFWRRCMRHQEVTLTAADESLLLPLSFQKPNGLYILEVDGDDWMEQNNEYEQVVNVEMINDPTDINFTRYQAVFTKPVDATTTAIMWWFASPPKPETGTDLLLLPGDMIAYGALSEYYRSINAEGSQDDARNEAENRMTSYLAQEMIPAKNELLKMSTRKQSTDYLQQGRARFAYRRNRYTT
jgi:hypothetical protein